MTIASRIWYNMGVEGKQGRMNYDSSISSTVSLSRVLDEMIMDGTEMPTILQFLKSHQDSLGDMFRHSAFAYDLYDLTTRTSIDGFLLENIDKLRRTEMLFALNSYVMYCMDTHTHDGDIAMLREKFRGNRVVKDFISAGWTGEYKDTKFITGEEDFIAYLNGLTDFRDMSYFLSTSYLAMAAFQASTFLKLSPQIQYIMVVSALKTPHGRHGRLMDGICFTYTNLVVALLHQLLMLDEIEMFNWLVGVLGELYKTNGLNFYYGMLETIAERLPKSMREHLAPVDMPQSEVEFPELVFDMNLLESQMEPVMLFLYAYLCFGGVHDGMKENRDLLEFFNLPFEWNELDMFKGGEEEK